MWKEVIARAIEAARDNNQTGTQQITVTDDGDLVVCPADWREYGPFRDSCALSPKAVELGLGVKQLEDMAIAVAAAGGDPEGQYAVEPADGFVVLRYSPAVHKPGKTSRSRYGLACIKEPDREGSQ
jgi:hypothetical protein